MNIMERLTAGSAQDGDCIVWMGARSNGYGRINFMGRNALAHRVAYEVFVGPIPDGLPLDHLCRNRACINTDHLEPVTLKENILRGEGVTALNARRTSCVNGHLLDAENTIIRRDGNRQCKACARANSRVAKARGGASS